MVAFLEVPIVNLMYTPEFTPGQWMWSHFPVNAESLLQRREQEGKNILYRLHLHPWLTEIIEEVARDQALCTNGEFTDSVDDEVAVRKHSAHFKTCPNCGDKNMPRRNRLCRNCNTTISAAQFRAAQVPPTSAQSATETPQEEYRVRVERDEFGKYQVIYEKVSDDQQPESPHAYLGNHHPPEPTTMRMGEPIFLNPCSFDALVLVLRDIGRQAGVRRYGGTREWLPVMCDGLPYSLCLQLIERFMLCSSCDHPCDGVVDAERHVVSQHAGVIDVSTFEQEFDWALLQPGPGHIEMNMLKGYVKLMWDVYWEDMVEVFNFKSDNAKKSARNISDHHKGFTLARIARESIARELVTPYVQQELASNSEHPDLSVAGFLKFCMNSVENPNYAFLFNTHVDLLDAIFAYRAGLRSGHSTLVEAARGTFAKLWSGQYHPMYRQLDAYDSTVNLCMPEILREKMKSPVVLTPVVFLSQVKGATSSWRS